MSGVGQIRAAKMLLSEIPPQHNMQDPHGDRLKMPYLFIPQLTQRMPNRAQAKQLWMNAHDSQQSPAPPGSQAAPAKNLGNPKSCHDMTDYFLQQDNDT